ncbi:MAG: hypothetical protein K8J08_09080 [Thermoanaerobaculia bacterium]|nr:hypothetical protein [Thermoanaerobaculia bacterium]
MNQSSLDGSATLLRRLDALYTQVRGIPFFVRLTLFTRILLAAGFIPTGMAKLLGHRFTTISVENPIGAFFEAMYQTGAYWQFLGASQILAGILVLIPSFAHLGAALFLPIMINILVITVALGFTGTPIVTGLMLVAVIYLCAWDYERFRGLLTRKSWPQDLLVPTLRLDRGEIYGFWVFALALLAFFGGTRGFLNPKASLAALGLGFAAGLFTLIRFLTTGRHLRPRVESLR